MVDVVTGVEGVVQEEAEDEAEVAEHDCVVHRMHDVYACLPSRSWRWR